MTEAASTDSSLKPPPPAPYRWIVLVVIALSVAVIGAGGQFPPEGPLALLYAQIHALFVEADQLAAESDDQQEQIDQLTGAVCELSVLTGNPTHPEFCEVVVTKTCDCEERSECACDPGPYFELESCESGYFPSPDPTPEPGEQQSMHRTELTEELILKEAGFYRSNSRHSLDL